MMRSVAAEPDEPTPPAPEHSPEVMDIDEAAAFLRMRPRALSNAAQEGRIPARKIGRGWRFSRDALHRWLGHEIEAPADRPGTSE